MPGCIGGAIAGAVTVAPIIIGAYITTATRDPDATALRNGMLVSVALGIAYYFYRKARSLY